MKGFGMTFLCRSLALLVGLLTQVRIAGLAIPFRR